MANGSVKLNSRLDRRLYTWATIVAVVLVFSGFAKTYYLKGVFGTPTLPPLVHIHGIVMTLWFALFVVQVRLVAARRTALHRRLGGFGAVLAGLVFVVGVATAIAGARRGSTPGPPPLVFLAVPLGDMLLFAVLTGLGLWNRRNREVHRRLMLVGMLGILPAAISRLPFTFIATGGPLVYFGIADLCILAALVADTIKNRRLHPAMGWGLVFVVFTQVSRLAVSGTELWLRVATWLVS